MRVSWIIDPEIELDENNAVSAAQLANLLTEPRPPSYIYLDSVTSCPHRKVRIKSNVYSYSLHIRMSR